MDWSWTSIRSLLANLSGIALAFITIGLLIRFISPGANPKNLALVSGIYTVILTDLKGAELKDKNFPNQGIWKSATNALIVLLSSGLIGGLVLVLFDGISNGIMTQLHTAMLGALLVGLICGFVKGGDTCIKHFLLRITLYQDKCIPWNYARFLDYCTERSLLQQVGGRYQFIHRLLQEHFAAMPFDKSVNDDTV